MRNKYPIPVSVAAAIAAAALAGCSPKSDVEDRQPSVTASNVTLTAEQRQHITTYRVAPSEYHKRVEVTGTVDFDQDQATTLIAPFSGPVSRLLVPLGEEVKAGEALAEAQSPDFATAISTYQKAVSTAKTARQLADLDRKLLPNHGVSPREAAQAESDAVNAEADRDAARQALVSLNVDGQTIEAIQQGKPVSRPEGILRAPVSGTVVEKLITPGELLQAGTTPCFTVADLSRVWVMAHVFGPDLKTVSVGDGANVETGTTNLSGTVENISALVDPDTRSVLVRVAISNPGDVLKKNMYVPVQIEARQPGTGLLAPVSAVLRDSENLPFVYVAQPGGSFARQPVTLGGRVEDRYLITSGLKAGDEIVVEGGLFMQFMQAQ